MKPQFFHLPVNLPAFPYKAKVYRAEIPTHNEVIRRLETIGSTLGFSGKDHRETKGYYYLEDGAFQLRSYKESDSFLFHNRALAIQENPAMAKKLLRAEDARDLSKKLLNRQGLIRNPVDHQESLYYTYYQDAGYTVVKSGELPALEDGKKDQTTTYSARPSQAALAALDAEKGHRTEIHLYRGFVLNNIRVKGPGARIIVSYVGEQLSREAYFWHKPKQALKEYELISPEEAFARLGESRQFSSLSKMQKLHSGKISGRLHDDVQMCYYALPPNGAQRLYVPVYAIRGTIETREDGGGKEKQYSLRESGFAPRRKESFRYDFTTYVLALPKLNRSHNLGDLKKEIII